MSILHINMSIDKLCKEGAEYRELFWEVLGRYHRMIELEHELERGKLAEEMNEFHRRCFDNDKPGRRHMMPFYWRKEHGYDGQTREVQIPIKVGSPRYEMQMAKYKDRMDQLKRRTPNYGRKI